MNASYCLQLVLPHFHFLLVRVSDRGRMVASLVQTVFNYLASFFISQIERSFFLHVNRSSAFKMCLPWFAKCILAFPSFICKCNRSDI